MLLIWGERELSNTIKECGRKLLTIDAPTDLVPTVSLIISQDSSNGTGQQQPGTKLKKKEGKSKGKKAKGGAAKVNAKPELSNKTGASQKNELMSLEAIYTKRANQGTQKL